MRLRRDALLGLAPIAILSGLALVLTGLAGLVQLVDDAHDIEPDSDRP